MVSEGLPSLLLCWLLIHRVWVWWRELGTGLEKLRWRGTASETRGFATLERPQGSAQRWPSPFGRETWQRVMARGFMQADVVWLWPEWAWPQSIEASASDGSICDWTVSSTWAAGSRWNLACGFVAASFDTSCGSLVLWLHSFRSSYRKGAHEAFFRTGPQTSHQGLVWAFLSCASRLSSFSAALEAQQAIGRCWWMDEFSEGSLSSLCKAQGMARQQFFFMVVKGCVWFFWWVSLAPYWFCSEKHCWGQGPWPRVHGSGLGDASDSDERSKR